MEILKIISLLIFFVSLYFGMNYYVVHRIASIFNLNLNVILISAVLAVSYPITMFIDRFFHSTPTRILYYISNSYAGTLFVAVFILMFFELINLAYPIFSSSFIFGGILLLLISSISIFALVKGASININEVNINNFGKEMKVVQLSDVHVGTIRNSGFLNKIILKVNELKPDLVLITGDLVDGSGKLSEQTFKPLDNISAPTYFVMGNHEFYEGEKNVAKLLKDNHAKVLRDDFVEFNGVNIIGLDYSDDRTYVSKILPKIKHDRRKPTILVNHLPIGYEEARNQGVDLQLSGHTHAGQIFPFNLIVKLFFSRTRGLYSYDRFHLYVSPGTGTWGPPMRLGSENEITVLNLR